MQGMSGGLSSYPDDVARPHVNVDADVYAPVSTPKAALPRILCVDDESRVVEGIRRSLRGVYDVVPAVGARAAMAILEQDVDFAVVISDLRMPDLDGVILLNQVRDGAPDIVRILLTGFADADAGVRAVNDGQIYRFLTKPCTPELLRSTLDEAVEYQRVAKMERLLVEQAIHGSVQFLTEILSLAQPAAFGRAGRLKRNITQLATTLNIRDKWAIELAAVFSQLGTVTLPPALIEKLYHGHQLTSEEQQMADRVSPESERLVGFLPRMEPVREILRYQHTHYTGQGSPVAGVRETSIPIGARLLAIVRDFDILESQGMSASNALDTMYGRDGWYDRRALDAFTAMLGADAGLDIREMMLADVQEGMIFVNDVTENELLLVARGQMISESVVHRIHSHWASFAGTVNVRVIVPAR